MNGGMLFSSLNSSHTDGSWNHLWGWKSVYRCLQSKSLLNLSDSSHECAEWVKGMGSHSWLSTAFSSLITHLAWTYFWPEVFLKTQANEEPSWTRSVYMMTGEVGRLFLQRPEQAEMPLVQSSSILSRGGYIKPDHLPYLGFWRVGSWQRCERWAATWANDWLILCGASSHMGKDSEANAGITPSD